MRKSFWKFESFTLKFMANIFRSLKRNRLLIGAMFTVPVGQSMNASKHIERFPWFFFQSYVCKRGIFDVEGISGFIFRIKPCEACHEPPTTPLKPLHTEYTLSFFSPCCCPLDETLEPPRFSQPNSRQEKRLRLTGLLYSLLDNQKYHKVRP